MVLDCRPATIANGAVQHPLGTTYTAVATVSCHAGYKVEGTGHLICLHNGLWSTDTECVIKGQSPVFDIKLICSTNRLSLYEL